MPVRRTATSHAVLALLSLRDWTTYELANQVRRRLNWLWPRAERKLYDEPKALAAAGLATATREFTGQRPRTVYGITEDGRAALHDWLAAPSAPRSGEWEAMLKVFFADAGSSSALRAVLDGIEREAHERLTALVGAAVELHAGRTEFPHRRHLDALSLRLQVDQELAVLRWVPWARAAAAGWTDPADPGPWDTTAALAEIVDRAGATRPLTRR